MYLTVVNDEFGYVINSSLYFILRTTTIYKLSGRLLVMIVIKCGGNFIDIAFHI